MRREFRNRNGESRGPATFGRFSECTIRTELTSLELLEAVIVEHVDPITALTNGVAREENNVTFGRVERTRKFYPIVSYCPCDVGEQLSCEIFVWCFSPPRHRSGHTAEQERQVQNPRKILCHKRIGWHKRLAQIDDGEIVIDSKFADRQN